LQYPSIIRAHNMCYSTLVMDAQYGGAKGVEYYEVDTALGRQRFAQSPRGVVPSLLEDLAQFRKQAKRDMADAKRAGDEWTAALANGRQNAFKITMNSCYGFLGATKGMLPCVPIAASVTATGREMIKQTAAKVQDIAPGSTVVYGDTGGARRGSPARRAAGRRELPRHAPTHTIPTTARRLFAQTPSWSS
jgi:DNA polymerase delta subunit 1